ncbi:MAG: glycosyl hydrolase 108 family protein [Planctomycetota bacterium]
MNADFEIAYGETELFEGGYVNDPDDKGGETHRGVTRRFHPKWPGWKIIDQIKSDFPDDFVRRINDNQKLVELSKTLYRDKYWAPIQGDQFTNQLLANKVFDTGVNQGVATSVRYLQDGLNLLNRNQKNYDDIKVDGKMGSSTLTAMSAFLKLEKGQPDYLLKLLNLMQAWKYVELMKADKSQEKFARGWLNRVNLR